MITDATAVASPSARVNAGNELHQPSKSSTSSDAVRHIAQQNRRRSYSSKLGFA